MILQSFLSASSGKSLSKAPPIIESAVRVYSYRKIIPDYVGDCIRVRRSSDNGEADIGFSGGLLDQTALLAHTGAGGTDQGFIVTWHDQGTTADFTQAAAGRQTQIVTNGVVNVDSNSNVFSDHTGRGLFNTTGPTITQPFSYFLVAQNEELSSAAVRMVDGSGGRIIIGVQSAAITVYGTHAGTWLNSSITVDQGVKRNFTTLYDSTNSEFYLNNSLEASGDAGSNSLSGQAISINATGANNPRGDGNYYELLVFDVDVSADRAEILDNQNAFYNLF